MAVSSLRSDRPVMTVYQPAVTEPLVVRRTLLGIAFSFMTICIILPLIMVVSEALSEGWSLYVAAITEPDALAAIYLTLTVAAIAVPLNLLFGISAAWCIAKFDFMGKRLLLTFIDLPFSVSPVIAGLIMILVFGSSGWLGESFNQIGLQVIFSTPGIVLATLFVTFPFVARELIPLMQTQGTQEEEAARVLGASGWTIFRRITLPNIKWGLLYGVVLCNARAMGDFGAVSVVSGHIRGLTNTLPLHVEVVYNEYQFTAAFACASLLAVLAIITLILKEIIKSNIRTGDSQ